MWKKKLEWKNDSIEFTFQDRVVSLEESIQDDEMRFKATMKNGNQFKEIELRMWNAGKAKLGNGNDITFYNLVDSDLSEQEIEEEEEDPNPKPSKRGRKSKGREDSPPTAKQVCEQRGFNDVDLEYTDADFLKLTTFKLFQQTYRPRIQAENPKIPMSKLVMLVAAKWREFCSLANGKKAKKPVKEHEEEDEDHLSNRGRKSTGPGRGRRKMVEEEEDGDD